MNWFPWAFGSALCSAAAAVLQKRALFRMDAVSFSLALSLLTLILTFPMLAVADVTAIPPTALLILLGKSIVGGIAFLWVMLSLEHNQISTALPLLGITPAVTALLAWIFTGEALHGMEWGGLVVMMGGTYLVEQRPGKGLLQPFRELWTSRDQRHVLAALALFGVSAMVDRMLVSGYRVDPFVVLLYQNAVYFVLFAVILVVGRHPLEGWLKAGWEQLPLILAVAMLTLAYRFAQLEASKSAPAALVLAIKRTSIIYASWVGGRIFADEHLSRKLVGCALIVVAGFLILRGGG